MATQVTSGQTNSCALLMDRSVYCWGQGTSGVLGDGTTTLRSTAGPVSGISDAVQVDLGLDSGCAVRAGGTVSCWGSNGAFRKLGTDSSVAFSAVPMEIPSMWISNAVAVQVGGNHACVRTRLRTLICWGESLDGRLGRTTLDAYGLPDRATDATEVAGLSTLSNFTCLTERGTGNIRCWGSGLGGGVTLSTVDAFPGQALEVSAGEAHACGLNDSQIVYCWGRNADGQLGNGATVATTMPATAVSFPL